MQKAGLLEITVQYEGKQDTLEIEVLDDGWNYDILADGTIRLTEFKGVLNETQIRIPSKVNGYTVTEIGNGNINNYDKNQLFKNIEGYNTKIETFPINIFAKIFAYKSVEPLSFEVKDIKIKF